MADTIRITASTRIKSTPSQVREQYRDIDHHIRNNVHPSIHYEWVPAAPGERKIKTTFRILGIPQFDVSLLEDGADGSFIIRYLEGTNAGMVLVHEFVEVEPGLTEVRLSADAPATLGRKLLGPLFVVGARQVMKKALAEDKRDLERGDFRPGTAAGNLDAALGDLNSLAGGPPAATHAVLEAACLISASDADIESSERDAIERLAKRLGANTFDTNGTLQRLLALAQTEQITAEISRIGAALAAAGAARLGLIAAATIGLVSEGMSLGELEALRSLGIAAGLHDADLVELVDETDARLSSGVN